MKTNEIDFAIDPPVPVGDPKAARAHHVIITATHKATGRRVVGKSVARFSKQFWKERARLHDELVKLVGKR